ncbi:MAG TPA: hypothetical protein VF188_00580 [Longimicrobiales bacterium]
MELTPVQLGDGLARLVWESFTDYIESGPTPHGPRTDGDDATAGLIAEELLILFLWVHTRACQQAFAGRIDADVLKATLDAMHRAVFEDLEAHGTPRGHLPLLEQRVSARYAEYYDAADGDGGTVGELAARRVSGRHDVDPRFGAALAQAAMTAARPLRDYLDEVVIIA